jgi:iron complex transport system substrate-binding protein
MALTVALSTAIFITGALFIPGLAVAQNRVALEREGYPMAFQNGTRVVTIDRQPSKILALGLGASELLIELGLADLVVGRTSEWPEGAYPPRYAQALAEIPKIDSDKVLTLETENDGPDFVYGQFGPTTPDPAFLKSYRILATNKKQFFIEVQDLGKIFNVEDRANAFLGELEKKLAQLSSKLNEADPVTVLVVRDLTKDALLTSGGPDFATEILHLAGARNVFSDLGPSPKPPTDEAASRKPNYVLVVDDGGTPLSDKILALRSDPVLSLLPAVAQNRLLTLHESYLLPGPRIAESAELLAKKFHPSLIR